MKMWMIDHRGTSIADCHSFAIRYDVDSMIYEVRGYITRTERYDSYITVAEYKTEKEAKEKIQEIYRLTIMEDDKQ